tara:strand:+ start:491 stop:910 length:420 start_codon:yes stop_codon:yes gene_type:complete
MFGKKVKLRLVFLSFIFSLAVLVIFLILSSLKEEVVYFISPSDIKKLPEITQKKIRIGGMVKENSIVAKSNEINFIVTDYKNEIRVSFSGSIPNLFGEGKGVVAEGYLKDRSFFIAKKILAKHDENYMPPEVKEALKEK